ncbi:ABC transporter permease [Mucilaginibacter sp. AW1-3]
MLRNYIKIAWRNIVNNKVYSALNIVGLAAGMAVALLIGLWVYKEYSYDSFLPNGDQLYHVKISFTSIHDGTHTQDAMSLPVAAALKKDYPEIKYVSELDWNDKHDLLVGDKKLYINGIGVGPDFLKMFQFPLIKGNAASVLTDPYSIVLTESTAKALFGNTDPMGKMIKIDTRNNLKVTGILKDIPANISSFQFQYIFPFEYLIKSNEWMKNSRTSWTDNSYQVLVMLQPNASLAELAPKIKDIVSKNSERMRPAKPQLMLHPLKDWHLRSDFKNGKVSGGFIDYVHMFSLIGILVLLIACINFMNLSTARSEKRAREVGVRKAIGSQRSDLIFQFLTESLLITFMAFVLSLILVQLAIPFFNDLTDGWVGIPYWSPTFWAIMLSYVLITGLLAGSRPAFYLSSFNPVKVLKGSIQLGRAATLPRKVLVVVQFSCSIALIISTVIVYQQIQHAKTRPTGYSADRVVISDLSDDLNKNYDALNNDLMQSGLVENVTRASAPVTEIYAHTSLDNWPGKNAGEESVNIVTIYGSETYFKTLGMQLVEGHDFAPKFEPDTDHVILNEAAIKRMGLKDPIGKEIQWNNHSNGRVKIIGIVKDALMGSPFTPVEPAIFAHGRWGNRAMYRLSSNVDPHDAIARIGKIFDKYNPAYPFSYLFADSEYAQKFNLEVLVGKLAGIFAGLAIFISCLGLFGLAAYVAEQRTKEIGIRKVLGATITQVWLLLSTDFIVLVGISCLIASPIAYYFLHDWLQKYDYRISIGPLVFVVASVTAMAITLLTISFQAISAALANPVKSLRSE